MKTTHSIYVVHFCDGRIKFGSTADVKKRMRYYRQEARRNGRDWLVWYSPKPFDCKEKALHAERAMRLHFRTASQKFQREWLMNTVDFKTVMSAADKVRSLIGAEVGKDNEDLPWFASSGQFVGLTA